MVEQSEDNYILSQDGLKLNFRIRHEDDPKAVVCLLHGHGEHSGRYEHVMDFLIEKQIACIAVDLRGHGLSQGQKGHMPSMERVLGDVEEALKTTRMNFLDVPIFLFGHSFGGCVVLNYVLKKPLLELAGFVASSPWLALAFEPPAWKVKAGNLLAGILPKFTLESELDPKALSKNEEVVKAYESDPLVHNKVSAKFFQEVTHAANYALEKANTLKINGLVYHGNADRIIDFHSSREFAKRALNHVTFHEFDGVFHEPHNDTEQQEVLQLLADWILKNCH